MLTSFSSGREKLSGLPHLPQKPRKTPEEDSNSALGLPAQITFPASSKSAKVIMAEPVAIWQFLQWQCPTQSGALAKEYRTAPQKHPPVIAIDLP